MSNVKLYDFQIAKKITHNLSNYHDLDHYHQNINKWILEEIKKNNFRVSEKNIDLYLADISSQAGNYIIKEINEK
jgi:hypothetical protein